jgi:hypothetical protein
LDVGVPDHLSPEGELRLDEVTQLFGRRGKSLEAYIRGENVLLDVSDYA